MRATGGYDIPDGVVVDNGGGGGGGGDGGGVCIARKTPVDNRPAAIVHRRR